MQLPHRLELLPSRRLAALLLVLHLAALFGLIALPLTFWSKLLAAGLVAVAGIVALREHALRQGNTTVRELILKADGSVEATQRDGSRFEARVSRYSTLWPWLIVLLLERCSEPRRHALVVLPDALVAEDLRILRSWLRWKLI